MCVLVSSLQLIRGQNWAVSISKREIFKFIKNGVDIAFWQFSMIVTFTTLCDKFFKLELPKEFRSICTSSFVQANQGTESSSCEDTSTYRLKLLWEFKFQMFITNCGVITN